MTHTDCSRKLQVSFANYYLVYKTLEHCDRATCKDCISRENAEYFLNDTQTFGYLTSKKDVPEESLHICPNHILHIGLVPELPVERGLPMTTAIHGNDQESIWKDQVALESKIYGTVSIKVYSHVVQEPPLALKEDGIRSRARSS